MTDYREVLRLASLGINKTKIAESMEITKRKMDNHKEHARADCRPRNFCPCAKNTCKTSIQGKA